MEFFQETNAFGAFLFFLAANTGIFICSVIFCWALGVVFSKKRIFDSWEPLRLTEALAALGAILLNSGVSVAGWKLWIEGAIVLREGGLIGSLLDCFVMIFAMDLGMYVFHRLAHLPFVFKIVHRFHHRHETTNPISLFVLHPIEVLGFGGLMIAFLAVYPMTLHGLLGYLTLNIVFGTLGHSGVEPFPRKLRTIPLLKYVGTSTFHAEHHEHPKYNFGFYTLIWDKLFGTLDPEYNARFDGIRSSE